MDKEIKDRMDAIRQSRIPKGYNRNRYMLYPEDWGEPCPLYSVLTENKERNEDLEYDKDDVLSVSGDYGVVNQIDLLGRSYAGESVAPYHIVYTGDIVYTKSPLKGNPHGIIKLNKGKPGIVSTLYAVYHCNNDITAQYIENYFCIDSYLNNYLKPIVKRGAKNDMKVNNEDVLTGVIPLPPLAEQKKISEILDHYDKLSKLCEAKVKEYKSLKKTCLSKMFPQNGSSIPELRFPGFTEAWEQRKLGEVVDVRSGKDYKHLSEGDVPVYGTGGYMLSVNQALSYDEDAIGIGRKGTIDKPYVLKAPFWTVDTLFYAVPRDNFDLGFTYCIFQNIDWKKKDESTGVPSLSKAAIESIDVLTPKHKEQRTLSLYFANLDNLITLHQREIEEYTKLKKAMTQLLLTGIVRV